MQDEPSWQQVVLKMLHDSVKMAMLGSTWELLEESCKHYRITRAGLFLSWPKCKKDQHPSLLQLFLGLGVSMHGVVKHTTKDASSMHVYIKPVSMFIKK